MATRAADLSGSTAAEHVRSGAVLLPLAAGLVVGLLTWVAYRLPPASTWDADQFMIGARALLHGQNPYDVVAHENPTGYPLFYPLPAILLFLPFALLPVDLARPAWAVACTIALVIAAQRYGRGLPVALLSACFLNAAILGQWSPLLTASVVLPLLAATWAAKPSIGLAFVAGYFSRVAVIVCAAVVILSVIVLPSWPIDWLRTLHQTEHTAPILRPWGFVLLLALLRWRKPEARLLVGLACVPQMAGLYDAVPLFLIPRTRWGGYALAALSYVAAFLGQLFVPRTPGMSLPATLAGRWPIVLACLYLPALAMLFMDREQIEAQQPLRATDSLDRVTSAISQRLTR